MADSEEQQVSSTTPMLNEEVHHYQADPDPGPDPGPVPDPTPGPGPGQDLFGLDDIVDLVGGAQDALERHMAEDSAPPAATPASEAPLEDPVPVQVPEEPVLVPEEPVLVPEEPVLVPEEPVVVLEEPVKVQVPEPVKVQEEPVKVPEPVKVQVPVPEPVKVPEEPVQVPVPVPVLESPVPDSTTPAPVPEEPRAVAPKAAPEVPEPPPGPPAPAPRSDAPPAAGPRNDAPPPAETPLTPAATREPAAPAKYSPSKAPPHPLMQFPTVLELLYWRDVRSSAAALGAGLLLLLSLSVCSIVSVLAYVGLALLSVTIAYRVYRGVLQAVQKTGEGHPFRQYLDQDLALPEDLVQVYGDLVLARLNRTVGELRRLFLVEDLVDSIKFAVFMWILTYVGALFNGLTLLILGLIGVFSCPIIYEKHQAQIDHYVSLVSNQVKDVVGKVQAKVPGMKPKAE